MNAKTEKLVTKVGDQEFNESTKIKMVSNPKRPGSKAFDRYKLYEKATTVQEYLALGATKGDLKYDFEKEFLKIAK